MPPSYGTHGEALDSHTEQVTLKSSAKYPRERSTARDPIYEPPRRRHRSASRAQDESQTLQQTPTRRRTPQPITFATAAPNFVTGPPRFQYPPPQPPQAPGPYYLNTQEQEAADRALAEEIEWEDIDNYAREEGAQRESQQEDDESGGVDDGEHASSEVLTSPGLSTTIATLQGNTATPTSQSTPKGSIPTELTDGLEKSSPVEQSNTPKDRQQGTRSHAITYRRPGHIPRDSVENLSRLSPRADGTVIGVARASWEAASCEPRYCVQASPNTRGATGISYNMLSWDLDGVLLPSHGFRGPAVSFLRLQDVFGLRLAAPFLAVLTDQTLLDTLLRRWAGSGNPHKEHKTMGSIVDTSDEDVVIDNTDQSFVTTGSDSGIKTNRSGESLLDYKETEDRKLSYKEEEARKRFNLRWTRVKPFTSPEDSSKGTMRISSKTSKIRSRDDDQNVFGTPQLQGAHAASFDGDGIQNGGRAGSTTSDDLTATGWKDPNAKTILTGRLRSERATDHLAAIGVVRKDVRKTLKCRYVGCDKTFSGRSGLENHVALDHLHRRWSCRVEGCGEEFRSAGGWKKHERTHKDWVPKSDKTGTDKKPRIFRCRIPDCVLQFADDKTRCNHEASHIAAASTG